MKAVTYHGKRDVRVDEHPDPAIEQPTDAIIRVTSSGICGSDLHLYEVMGAFMDEGDVLGHEPMGIVEAVGSEITQIKPGDRVVVPFNVSCGRCYMCQQRLEMARRHGVEAIDVRGHDDVGNALRELTSGRGPDSVIDAVGMEAHGAPLGKLAHQLAGLLPDSITTAVMEKAGVDRLSVLHT